MKYTGIGFLALWFCFFAGSARAGESDETNASRVEIAGVLDAGAMFLEHNGDPAGFEEYSDRSEGLYGNAEVRANKDDLYLKLEGENVGRKDQSYNLRGGRFGQFEFNLFYDETPHNYTDDGKSYLNGVGTANLTDSGNRDDPGTWGRFDYSKDRSITGFKGEYFFESPYYVEFGAHRRKSRGVYPLGGPGGVELPAPVDWEENNWFVGGGYQGRSFIATLRVDASDFENDNHAVSRDDHITSLQPDSDYYKVAGKIIFRSPFMNSTLALRANYSEKENTTELSLVDSSASGSYHGEVETTRLDAVCDFTPVDRLEVKLIAQYYDADDESDVITIRTVATQPYDHEKGSAGLEGAWRLTKESILDAGYRFTDVERSSRTDNDATRDHLAFLQYRKRFFERLQFRGRYERMDREGDYDGSSAYAYHGDVDSYEPSSTADDGVRRYDVADQILNRLELSADIFFMERLGAGVEYAWWERDYDDAIYGLTGVKHHEIYISASHGAPEEILTTVYVGYEYDENKLETNRNWSQAEEFDTLGYGVSVEFSTMEERLHITASWDHSIVDGSADFAPESGNYQDLNAVDDCTSQRFDVKGVYDLAGGWELKLGYVFEKFDQDDGQYDGYTYLPSGATLTGAYADPDYDAHMVYVGVAFRL